MDLVMMVVKVTALHQIGVVVAVVVQGPLDQMAIHHMMVVLVRTSHQTLEPLMA
jgi:hypothetical protein